MPALTERSSFLADYDAFLGALGEQPESVAELRRAGLARFEEVGIPTKRNEEWRHTNVAPVAKTEFQRASADVKLTSEQVEPFRMADCIELIFVNGHFAPEHSKLDGLPGGVFVGSLAQAMEKHLDLVTPHLGRYADGDHPFVALNTAHLADGAFIHVPKNKTIEQTIHLIFLGIAEDGKPTVAYPRNLFVVEQSAQLTVVESWTGFSGETYFTCPVTEIYGAANSVIDHYRIGQESLDAYHVATQKLHLERDANFFTHSVSYGGALVRNDIQAMLAGENIHCTLNGLYLGRGKQFVDHHMRVDHAMPNCHSYELFKGILEDQSKAVFNGRIHVHQDAQKTDAKQSSRHLLLSDKAFAQSNPQLEIYADDVRCTHGSTTGHLDDEALFYLRSRGIGVEAAKSLLTYAFAAEVLDEFRLESIRTDMEEFLFTRLPKGDIVRQAV